MRSGNTVPSTTTNAEPSGSSPSTIGHLMPPMRLGMGVCSRQQSQDGNPWNTPTQE